MQECFQPGFVVELKSKLSGKKLSLIKGGLLNCKGDGGASCKPFLILYTTFPFYMSYFHTTGHFRVKSTGRSGVYKFQNVAQPDCYLGYVKGFIVGYVSNTVAMVIHTHMHARTHTHTHTHTMTYSY